MITQPEEKTVMSLNLENRKHNPKKKVEEKGNHSIRNCSRVKEISDEVPTSGAANLQPLSVKLQNILDQLKSLQTEREDSIQLIKGSYDEQLQKLTETRRNINAALDKIETNTKNEMVATMTKLEYSLKSNVEKCTRLQNELNRHREAIQEICNKDTPKLSFITSKKSSVIIQKSESFLKENFKSSIKFQPNSEIIDYLSQLSGLGKIEESNQTLLLQEIGEQVCELNTQLSRQEGEVDEHIVCLESMESSTNEDLRRLFEILKIDVMAECGTALFPAFRHGCGALQGIVTRGKDIFDNPVFSETERKIVFQRCIQLYTTSILIEKIKASSTKHEQLRHVAQFSREKQNISFPALVAVDKEQCVEISKWIDSLSKEITGLCVLLVDDEPDTPCIAPACGVYQSKAILEGIFEAADDLLERVIFAVLKNLVEKCVAKYGDSTKLSDIEKKRTLQSIYNYARTAYTNSEVPEHERPDLPDSSYTYPKDIHDVVKELLEMKGVVRCSKNIGHLEVIIENTHDSEATMNGVTLYLQHKNIQPLFIRGTIAPLISSGDRVSNERLLKQIPEKFATLGGFALQFPKTTSNPNFNTAATSLPSSPASQHTRGKLVALISRHVATAIGCECVNAYNDTETFELGKINNIHDNPLVDIIPFDIKEDCINKCDRRFKTEIGIQMYGQVSPEERIREGDQVYIWGAATSLGLGTIDSVNLETPNGLLITIHDRNEGESFCKEGDSGAMVCATDRRERTLYAIAMIQGKLHRSSGRAINVAVSLNEGFKILETHYLSKFSLCNDQPHA